jgi:hypothetical protein
MDQGPYEFAVSGAGDDYIDLANAYLFVEFCPVDFNLDLAACLTFCPSMTSDVRLKPVFKASRPKVLAPGGDTSL